MDAGRGGTAAEGLVESPEGPERLQEARCGDHPQRLRPAAHDPQPAAVEVDALPRSAEQSQTGAVKERDGGEVEGDGRGVVAGGRVELRDDSERRRDVDLAVQFEHREALGPIGAEVRSRVRVGGEPDGVTAEQPVFSFGGEQVGGFDGEPGRSR